MGIVLKPGYNVLYMLLSWKLCPYYASVWNSGQTTQRLYWYFLFMDFGFDLLMAWCKPVKI